MPEQLDFSVLSTIRDPELRASIERLGSAITEALPVPVEQLFIKRQNSSVSPLP